MKKNKKIAITPYQFPTEVLTEYKDLTATKKSIFKNLSYHEEIELSNLYRQLEIVWQMNNSEKLQLHTETDLWQWKEVHDLTNRKLESFTNNSLERLEHEENQLNQKKGNLNIRLATLKANLQNVMNLITENEALEQRLKAKQAELTSKSKQLKDKLENENKMLSEGLKLKQSILITKSRILSDKQATLTSKLQTLNDKSETLTQALHELKEKKQKLKANLDDFNTKLNKAEAPQKKKMKKLEDSYEININKLKEKLQASINKWNETEADLLKQLKTEIVKESNLPTALKSHLTTSANSTISNQLSTLKQDTKKLSDTLNQKLTKIGMTEQQFFELMAKNTD